MVSSRGKDITIEDGRVLNSYSEEYRKYCDAATVLKSVDPIAYRIGMQEYLDFLEEE